MRGLQRVLRDKSSNNLIVAVLVGFGTWNFISGVADWWNQGPNSYWHGQVIRQLVAFAITLVVAEIVSWMAK